MNQKVAPIWMNSYFFEKVLRKSERDESIKVSNYDLLPSDKFTISLFRANIKYSQKFKNISEISLIIKTNPFLEVETKIYLEVLPEIQKLLNLTDDKKKLSPNLIYSSSDPTPVLVFENMCTKGFLTTHELSLSLELTKLAVNRLGQYHAASMVMDYNKQGIKEYTRMQKNDPPKIQYIIDALRTWPGYEIYVEKFERVLTNFEDLLKKHTSPNPINEGYNVLNHGDFQTKNLLFKNIKDPKEADLVLIDYQNCFYGSPAYDIYYSVYLMGDLDLRENHFNEILSNYYGSFSKSLESMGFMGKVPTLIDLQVELLKHGFFEVLLNVRLLLDDVGHFSNDEQLIKNFQRMLPRFLTKGFLD